MLWEFEMRDEEILREASEFATSLTWPAGCPNEAGAVRMIRRLIALARRLKKELGKGKAGQ